jgi:hypothetical protein
MSMDYAIKINIYAPYTQETIYKILHRGSKKKFIYHDYVFGVRYKDSPIIDAQAGAVKIINAYNNDIEGGPSILVIVDTVSDNNVFFWFEKVEGGGLKFTMGDFSNPLKKGHFIDFAYYIRMALDLCEDFSIFEVRTDMF